MFTRFFQRRKILPPCFGVRGALKSLPGTSIRPYEPGDFAACLDLYKQNEPGRFPPDTSALYAAHLRAAKNLVLVLEQGGEVVGTGGIALKHDPMVGQCGWLTFGLIAPACHRSGLGTALLLARIALLPISGAPLPVFLIAVWRSRSFYEQFGFRLFCRNTDGSAVSGHYITKVSPEAVAGARDWLRMAGVTMPTPTPTIPMAADVPLPPAGEMTPEHAGVYWLGGTMREVLTCAYVAHGQAE